jgi:hypothetical protein
MTPTLSLERDQHRPPSIADGYRSSARWDQPDYGEAGVEEVADALPRFFDGARCCFPEQCFELGKDLFYGVEIGAVGRQKVSRAPALRIAWRAACPLWLPRLSSDHDVAVAQCWGQELFNPGQEAAAIDEAIQDACRPITRT